MDWWSERPLVIKDQPIVWPIKIFDTFFIMLLQEHAWCPVVRETPCNLISIIYKNSLPAHFTTNGALNIDQKLYCLINKLK